MNHELAKKLKEAGFREKNPQLKYEPIVVNEDNLDLIQAPTLSELIAACGGYVDLMVWNGDRAVATNIDAVEGHGSTPEEAVVNLWLELNKK